jgi:hypothetical protein
MSRSMSRPGVKSRVLLELLLKTFKEQRRDMSNGVNGASESDALALRMQFESSTIAEYLG